jgi:transposase
MKQKKSKAWWVYLIRTHHTIREIAELVGLNKSTLQDIKAKIDNYGSPLPHKQTGRPLKINERIERHVKRIIREDPFASYKEIDMELAKQMFLFV